MWSKSGRGLKNGRFVDQIQLLYFSIAMVAAILGVVGFALDHPEIYLAYMILSLIITTGNVLALFYFVYVAIDTSMKELYLPQRYV